MGIIINDNHKIEANKPAEYRYLNISQPWATTNEVNTCIPLDYRYTGLTVNVLGNEYWYHGGINNNNLIAKLNGGGFVSVTNGLTSNNNILSLGGFLTGNTVFDGGYYKYTLQYAGDYSSNYTNRSLVDKEYVDSITSGVKPINAVTVATTGNITLSGLQTIDTVSLTGGMRVLVKDQINKVENGIYDASSGAWMRSSDYDDTSEVVNGSYAFVLSGSTNIYYSFVMISPNPVDVGVDEIKWAIFNHQIGISAGVGINITNIGGNNVINVDGAAIAGNGIIWSGNKFNTDYNTQTVGLYGVTGVTNGLRKYNSHNISLGGDLTGTTNINTKYDAINSFQVGNGSYSGNWYGGMLRISRDNVTQSENYGVLGARVDTDNYSVFNASSINGASICSVINNVQRNVVLNSCGLNYGACYHSSYTNRSLVDKEFVTNYGLSGVTNGLSVTNKKVKLGGILTGLTEINTSNNSFKIKPDSNNYGLFDISLNNKYNTSSYTVCSTDTGTTGNWWGFINNSNCSQLSHWQNTSNGNNLILRNYDILMYHKTAGAATEVRLNSNGLNYCQDYSSCYINRSLVDKEYVDNMVTGYSNTISTKIVGTVYTTERYDNYVGISGASCVYLYANPVLGQKVIIVDACGNALVDNITIDGNGVNINNSACSAINTNYGAITFVYNGQFWSPISFIN